MNLCCKHCGSTFTAPDQRTKYCGPQCLTAAVRAYHFARNAKQSEERAAARADTDRLESRRHTEYMRKQAVLDLIEMSKYTATIRWRFTERKNDRGEWVPTTLYPIIYFTSDPKPKPLDFLRWVYRPVCGNETAVQAFDRLVDTSTGKAVWRVAEPVGVAA